MPNWCSNVVTFTHADTAEIARIATAFTGSGLMQEFAPCPQDLLDTTAGSFSDAEAQTALLAKTAANVEKYGYPNWYDWCVANWGTKWDVQSEMGDVGYEQGDTSIQISFDSAWSPPLQFYVAMEELGFTVDAFYYEPGMCFCGHYTEGSDDYYEFDTSNFAESGVPENIDEMFGISDSLIEWADEQPDSEDLS